MELRLSCSNPLISPLPLLTKFHDIMYRKYINSSPTGQNGCHFTDNIFKLTFMNEKFCILIRILLKFVPEGPIDKKSALVLVMDWCRTGDKPLLVPMLTQFTDAYVEDELTLRLHVYESTNLLLG